MTWLDKLERRIGFIAIPGLIRIVVAFTALVYLLTVLNPDFLSILALNPDGSGLRPLPVPDAQLITELAWSPGGNRIAFVRSAMRWSTSKVCPSSQRYS